MVKIIFSDFDNTLLYYYSDKNYFDEYQIDVLKKVKENGIKFCVVTGRSVSFFEQFSNLLGVIDYIIGSNGAVIYDVVNKEYIYQDNLKKEVLNQLISYAIEHKYSFVLNCLDKRYQYGEWEYVKGEKYECDKEYYSEQMILSFSKEYSDEIANFVERVGSIVVNHTTDWGDEYSLDINNETVSKGNAVKWLCKKLDIDMEDTVGFGDGSNDISMFQVVGKSVSIGNASDKVKENSNDVALCCEENGVFKYIEDKILR